VSDEPVTLKEHILALLAQMDLRLTAAILAAKEAVSKAETATEKRFESVNEFRQTLSDQAKNFVSRIEYDALQRQVTELKDRFNTTEGRTSGLSLGWGILLSVITAAGILVTVFLKLN
jgi:hypothetical protein